MRTKHRLVDAAMVLLLPLLMAYSLVGEAFHEFAGTLMLLLFLAHHWLNRAWLKNLFRGKYTALRSFQTCLNLLLLVFMIVQPLCGILMSKHLYTFLPTEGLSSLARAVHLPLANWGFVLMCLHAGMHLGSMLPKDSGKKAVLIPLGAVSLYGVYAFFKRQIPKYMFLKLPFVFFDYGEPFVFFLLDYISIMILFAMIGYGVTRLLTKKRNKK